MSGDMRSRLQAYYTRAFPDRQGVQVSDLINLSAGWESDMYSFAVEYGPAGARRREELILRIYPGDNAHRKAAHEFRGMRQLYRAGYPVPHVLILECENSPFGSARDRPLGQPFVIMEKIEGQILWPLLFGASKDRQQELMTLFCDLLVRLHALEWRPYVDDASKYDTGDPYTSIDRELGKWRDFLPGFSQPGFMPVLEWLEARRNQVPCPRPSPIHWDFHPGNVLLRDDGSAVVVDWTGLDVSDARLDLAWTLLLIGTHEGPQWRDPILREYERLAGARVEQIAYFDVVACARRLLSVAISLSEGPEKLGMRAEAVAMMKRQMGAIGKVYDLLLERTGIEIAEIEGLLA